MNTTNIVRFYHDLVNQGLNDTEVDTLFDSKQINTLCHMDAKTIKLAMGCEHNQSWSCMHDSSYGQDCIVPCKNCTTTQLKIDSIICPICDSPVEQGHCLNKLCVNHG